MNVVQVKWLLDKIESYVTVEKILEKASPTTMVLVEAALNSDGYGSVTEPG